MVTDWNNTDAGGGYFLMMKIFYRHSFSICIFSLLYLSAGCSTRARPTGDPLCDTATSISLDEAYDRYFSATPSSGAGGCAQRGCHGDGAGGLRFTNVTEFYAAVVDARSPTSGRVYVTPGEPGNSYLYQRIASAAQGERMPLGGPYLNDAQLAEVAGWICSGAPRPQGGTNGASLDLAPSDGGGGPGPRTSQRIADELDVLLWRVGEHGPYVVAEAR